MLLERSRKIYESTAHFIENQKADLERWRQQAISFKSYLQEAAEFLEAAYWQPPQIAQFKAASDLTIEIADFEERAAATRLLAGRTSDDSVK